MEKSSSNEPNNRVHSSLIYKQPLVDHSDQNLPVQRCPIFRETQNLMIPTFFFRGSFKLITTYESYTVYFPFPMSLIIRFVYFYILTERSVVESQRDREGRRKWHRR